MGNFRLLRSAFLKGNPENWLSQAPLIQHKPGDPGSSSPTTSTRPGGFSSQVRKVGKQALPGAFILLQGLCLSCAVWAAVLVARWGFCYESVTSAGRRDSWSIVHFLAATQMAASVVDSSLCQSSGGVFSVVFQSLDLILYLQHF